MFLIAVAVYFTICMLTDVRVSHLTKQLELYVRNIAGEVLRETAIHLWRVTCKVDPLG